MPMRKFVEIKKNKGKNILRAWPLRSVNPICRGQFYPEMMKCRYQLRCLTMCTNNKKELYFNDTFQYMDGYLYCEDMKVVDILQWLQKQNISPHSPCFIYSKNKIVSNVNSYMQPLRALGRKFSLNFAVKANMNPSILKVLKDLGCSCTLVSGYELKLCLELGFNPEFLVLNGNGKQAWEIEMAVKCGCILNIDSLFNFRQTQKACHSLGKGVRVLLRVNPEIDLNVHKYLVTSTMGSKFGIKLEDLDEVMEEIKGDEKISLVGLHCHLGSTIEDVSVFRDAATFLSNLFKDLKGSGFSKLEVMNIGGGLAIPYQKHGWRTSKIMDQTTNTKKALPQPCEIINIISEVLGDDDMTLILEPGRSLIGTAAVLATSVLGVKKTGSANYIVVDGAMTEVIRPALYNAYHHIDLAEPTYNQDDRDSYRVVGPVCESGDFLGKDRYLPTPHEGCCMAVFDVGAYCSSMSSNYNMRPQPADILVDKSDCTLIRRPDTFELILQPYRNVNDPCSDKLELN